MSESNLTRIGVSMEENLLNKFDGLIAETGYKNRSEALRDLVRDALLQHNWKKDEQLVAGTIMLFYNHQKRNLMDELTKLQHDMHHHIMATTHFHLDEANCLELIVVKGKAKEVQQLKDNLASLKGVAYSGFTIAPIEHI